MSAKIIRSGHQPVIKQELPKPVHGYAAGQGVFGVGQPLGKTEAVARQGFVEGKNRGGHAGSGGFSRLVEIPPRQHVPGTARATPFLHHHQVHGLSAQLIFLLACCFQFSAKRPSLRIDLPQIPIQPIRRLGSVYLQGDLPDFRCGQGAVKKLEFVHEVIITSIIGAAAEGKGETSIVLRGIVAPIRAVDDVPVKSITDHFGLQSFAIQIDRHARSPAGAIVSHR